MTGQHDLNREAANNTGDSNNSIWAWRHPLPTAIEGYCIGRTDVAVDPRRARRLARRIERVARQHGLPREVWTSPMRRCADVGRWLRRWGWMHHIDPALLEMDFGAWEGVPWSSIPFAQVDAWKDDLAHYAPGGGETLSDVLMRAARWQSASPAVLVAHSGWMRARRWLETNAGAPVCAAQFPASPGYGVLWKLGATLATQPARA